MQEKVYKKQIKDIDELRARILTAWVIGTKWISALLIKQSDSTWRTRIRACIKAKGRHFKHTLRQ